MIMFTVHLVISIILPSRSIYIRTLNHCTFPLGRAGPREDAFSARAFGLHFPSVASPWEMPLPGAAESACDTRHAAPSGFLSPPRAASHEALSGELRRCTPHQHACQLRPAPQRWGRRPAGEGTDREQNERKHQEKQEQLASPSLCMRVHVCVHVWL